VKLTVLYREDGRIVSLSRMGEHMERDDKGVPPLRSAVAARDGQRVAIVDLDPAWHDRPLSEIHQHFVVEHDGQAIRLKERGIRAPR
jgi:hypothetical protein